MPRGGAKCRGLSTKALTELQPHRTRPVSDQDGCVQVEPGCGCGLLSILVALGGIGGMVYMAVVALGRGF
jgi:hypothetical protein